MAERRLRLFALLTLRRFHHASHAKQCVEIGMFEPGQILGAFGDGLGLDPALAKMVKTRVAISNGHPSEDLEVSVLEEGASTFGDFDNFTLEGGNMSLATALAGELGADLHLSDPVRRVAWSGDGVTVTSDGGEVEADASVIAIPAKPLAEVQFDPPLEGATAEALRSVSYGQNSKLFLPLRSTEGVPPSAIMSVAGHFWTYTQLLPSGDTAPFLTSYTGTAAAIEDLGGTDPAAWVERTVALRDDLEPLAARAMAPWGAVCERRPATRPTARIRKRIRFRRRRP